MKIIKDDKEIKFSIFQFSTLIMFTIIFLSFLVVVVPHLNPQTPSVMSNKFSPDFHNQCWKSNTNPTLAYCSPVNIGNKWVDLRTNPLEKFLN